MECQPTSSEDPLRQGDIFAAHPGTESWKNPWTRFGVIISADCDIARPKGPLVYLPILDHGVFLRDIWLPAEAAKVLQKHEENLGGRLSRISPTLTIGHILGWAEEGGLDLVKAKLISADRDQGGDAASLFENASLGRDLTKMIEQPNGSGDPAVVLRSFLELKKKIESGNQPPDKAVLRALESLAGRLDTWLLKEIVGLDTDLRDPANHGYVVNLRSFSVVDAGRILIVKRQWYDDPTKYFRVCRLKGVYKSDLLQRFANLFTRVGLDDHRDEEHHRAFKSYSQRLFPPETK